MPSITARLLAASNLARSQALRTAVCFDPLMVRHGCMCGQASCPSTDNPEGFGSILMLLKQAGTLDRCVIPHTRKAAVDDIKLFHKSEYVDAVVSTEETTIVTPDIGSY